VFHCLADKTQSTARRARTGRGTLFSDLFCRRQRAVPWSDPTCRKSLSQACFPLDHRSFPQDRLAHFI